MTTFVSPISGETFWYLSNGISKALFEQMLALFAKEAGAGKERSIIVVLDNAGGHSLPGLVVPEGLRLVFLPAYSPELQPAETLWPLLDEPIANKHFASLDDLNAVIAERCNDLVKTPDIIKGRTGFHWWPNVTKAN